MPIPAGIATPSGTVGSPAELLPTSNARDVVDAQEPGLKVPVSLSRKGETKRLRGKSIVASGKTRCCSREPTPETEPLLRPDVLELILLELIPTREAFLQGEVLVYGNWMDVSNLDEKFTRHALAWEGVALTQWLLQLRLLDTSWNQAIKNSSLWVQLEEVFFQFPGPPMQPTEQPFERFYSKLRNICVPCYLNDRITSSKGRRRPSFAFGWVPMCNNHSYIVKSVQNPPRHRALCWKCFDEGGKNENCAIVQTGDDEAFENKANQMGNACGTCRKKALEEALNRSWKHLGILLRGSSALIHAPAMRYINWGDWSASDAAEEVASNYWLYCYTRWPDYYASTLQLLNESAVNEQRNIVLAFVETRPGDAGDLWHLWEHAWVETKAVLARTSNFRGMLTRIKRHGFSTVYHSLIDQYRNSLVFTENGRSARCPSIDDMERLLYRALPRELNEEQEERTIRESVYEYLSQVARGGIWMSVREASLQQKNHNGCLSGMPIEPDDFDLNNPRNCGAPSLNPKFAARVRADDEFRIVLTLPPPMPQRLQQIAEQYWLRDVIRELVRPALLNLAKFIKNSSRDETQAAIDLFAFELDDILAFLRQKQLWVTSRRVSARNGTNEPASVPLVPASARDIGRSTSLGIMSLWDEIIEPLKECNCKICARGKRKREAEEEDTEVSDEVNPDCGEVQAFLEQVGDTAQSSAGSGSGDQSGIVEACNSDEDVMNEDDIILPMADSPETPVAELLFEDHSTPLIGAAASGSWAQPRSVPELPDEIVPTSSSSQSDSVVSEKSRAPFPSEVGRKADARDEGATSALQDRMSAKPQREADEARLAHQRPSGSSKRIILNHKRQRN
ncbi:hypothetical protein CBOM_03982 [Ceraceosorus bombacis]|uniref:Uncharacterized protein n=1 Tax=Ceraceosorus bombacis TaxID=401625 RepID=A0A0P1BML5_9BASI|nr:hypothetical protein CBOM_03982 [Ceraceosorus bombacis]